MSLAYWCVLIAALLPYALVGVAKLRPDYNNRNPRAWASKSNDYLVQRAYAAQAKHGAAPEGQVREATAVLARRLEDLGKGLRSQIGTMYGSLPKGPRYLEMAEGYIMELGLDENDEIIGYKYVQIGKMMEAIRNCVDPKEALEKNTGTYGRFAEAVKTIDPRKQ